MKVIDSSSVLLWATLSLTAAADVCVTSVPAGSVNDPILSSVSAVAAPLSTLSSLVAAWKDSDGLMGALGIQQSYYPLYSAVLSLSSAVAKPPTIASNNVVVYVNSLNSLVSDISNLMGVLNAKANSFAGVGAAQIVVGDIVSLAAPASAIEASLFAGFPSNAPCVQLSSANQIASSFSAAFGGAAKTYSISSGIPAFPTAPSACQSYCAPAASTTAAAPVTTTTAAAVTTSTAAAATTSQAPAGTCITSVAPGAVTDPILSSVSAVAAPLSTLSSLVAAWKDSDGLMGALGIQQSYYPLYSAVLSLSSAVAKPPTIASNNVVVYVNSLNSLVSDISNLMGVLNAKANSFAGVGAAQIVVGDIVSLAAPASAIEASLFAGFPNNAPCAQLSSANQIASSFSAAFGGAAKTYSISSGIPAFPTAPSACQSYCAAAGQSTTAAVTTSASVSSKPAVTTSTSVSTSTTAAASSAPAPSSPAAVSSKQAVASSAAPASSNPAASSKPAVVSSSPAVSTTAAAVITSTAAATTSQAPAGTCITSVAPGAVTDPILSSVSAVAAPLSTLSSLVAAWKDSDGLMGALGIQQSYYPLYSAVISLSSAVAKPPTIASNNVVVYVNSLNSLVSDISNLMGVLNAKANSFAGVGAAQIVVGDIVSLAAPASAIEASLFAGFPSNAPCVQLSSANQIASSFSAAFGGAAKTYSISSGIPAFPTAPSACQSYCAAAGQSTTAAVTTSASVSSKPAVTTSAVATSTTAAASSAPAPSSPAAVSSKQAVASSAAPASSNPAASSKPAVVSSSPAVSTTAAAVITSTAAATTSQAPAGDCITSVAPVAVTDPILSSVSAVAAPLSTLSSLIAAWKDSDGLMGALGIQQSYYPLYSAVISLSSAVAKPPTIASNNVVVYVNSLNSLVSDISNLMGALNAKANSFASVGAAQIVVGDIVSLAAPASAIEASLFAGFPNNAPCVQLSSANQIASSFSAAFGGAAKTYSISSGIPAFPTAPSACQSYCAAAGQSTTAVTTNAPVSSKPAVTTSTSVSTSTTAAPVSSSKAVTTSTSLAPTSTTSTPAPTTSQPAPTNGNLQVLTNDVQTLTNSINSLDNMVKSFKHGFFSDIVPLIKLQNAAVDLGSLITKVTKDFKASPQLNAADTLAVATPFTNMLGPLQAVLSDIGQKKPEFDKAILNFISASGLIKGQVVHLKQVSDALIAQVRSTIYPQFVGVIDPIAKQVDAAFDAQINGVYKKTPTIYIPFKLFS